MKNLLIAILTIAVVGLSAYVVTMNRTDAPALVNTPLAAAPIELASVPEPLSPPTPEPVKAPEAASIESAFPDVDSFSTYDGDEKNEAAVEQLEKAHDLIAALHEQNVDLEEKTQPSMMNGLRQMMESPEMKDMMRQGMARGGQRRNAGLLKRLNLNEEQQAEMNELLIENSMAQMETGINWITGNHEASRAQTIAAREKMHKEIGEKFGGDVLSEYQYWEDSKNEREAIQRFNRSLGDAGSLDDETSDQLVGLLYDARADFPELEHLSRPENFNPKEMTPERRDALLGQMEQLHQNYAQDAASILSPEQVESLQANLDKQRGRLDGMLKHTHNMFGNGSKWGAKAEAAAEE